MVNKRFSPIAIVGYGCIYPNRAYNTELFWKMIIEGQNTIECVPKDRWDWNIYYSEDRTAEDKTYCRKGGCILDYEFSNKAFEHYDSVQHKFNRTQQMMMDTVLEALGKSKYTLSDLNKQNVGYLVGNMLGDDLFPDYSIRFHAEEIFAYLERSTNYQQLNPDKKEAIKRKLLHLIEERFQDIDKINPEKYSGSSLVYLLKELLGLKGPSGIVDGACSSGILVIDEAVKVLHSKEMDMCIVSGTLGSINVLGSVGFAKIGGLTSDLNRPLDLRTSGLNPSEGVGTILIKRLSDAIKDGDEIYGVITGTGSADDGKGKSIYAPSWEGQHRAMKKALELANVTPGQIDYIEVHATGTPTGDKEEMTTLKKLFEGELVPKQSVAIGSIKSQIGHSFSAAGMANLIKVIEGYRHDILPPTWNYEKSPEEIHIEETPFYVNCEARKWVPKPNQPRRAVVNAFGFGGINSSLVIEEYIEEYHTKLLDADPGTGNTTIDFSNVDIAVVGVGCIDVNATGKDEWWSKIHESVPISRKFPEKRWNKDVSDIFSNDALEGCFIEEYTFPWLKFKIPPKVLAQLDRGQPLCLMAADEAIEDYGISRLKGPKTSVYLAKMMMAESQSTFNIAVRHVEYVHRLQQIDEFKALAPEQQQEVIDTLKKGFRNYVPPVAEDCLPGYMDNVVAGRISNYYDFQGTSMAFDSGSGSFALALKQGVDNLVTGESDHVIVGAVHANMSPEYLHIFRTLLETENKKDAKCKCCGSSMKELVPSEGAVFFVLKRFEDVSPEDKVYGRIKAITEDSIEHNQIESDYHTCCNTMRTDNGKFRYYFGAQAAFGFLKSILALHNNDISVFPESSESASGKVIKVTNNTLFSNEYSIFVVPGDYEGRIQVKKRVEDENTIYIGANSWNEVTETVKQISTDHLSAFKDADNLEGKEYRLAIVYSTPQELKRKLKLLVGQNK